MSPRSDDLVDHTVIPLVKLDLDDAPASRRSTLTQREPPNPYKNKRKIVAFASIVVLGLTVWSCIAAYHVVKHIVWGPDNAIDEITIGAEIIVPTAEPLAISDVRWVAKHIDGGLEKRSLTSHPTIACLVNAKRHRLQQVLATTKTWLPTCDYHALISFGDVPEQLKDFPHVAITHPSGIERCADRIALNVSATLFPDADWVFLAPDDAFVMVDRLREWLRGIPADAYPDLAADGKPALLISGSTIGSLNITECDQAAAVAVASLLKGTGLKPLPTVDSSNRTIILNKYKTDNQHDLSPLLSIIQKVTASEMILMHHIHSPAPA